MSDPAPLPAAHDAVTLLEQFAVLTAVADPVRYALLKELAAGDALSVVELASRLRRPTDGISKHLRVLRDARIVRVVDRPGTDARKAHHELPALFRTKDAAGKTIVDFGAVVLRFG